MSISRTATKKIGKETYKPLGITTSWYCVLKWIAIICMTVDHTATTLLDAGVIAGEQYLIMKTIGRIAFPLFAFELVECFHFTKNKKKHLLELGILAVVSELPFDLVLVMKNPREFPSNIWLTQNVCVTLFLCFLFLCVTNMKWNNAFEKVVKSKKIASLLAMNVRLGAFAVFAIAEFYASSDYTYRAIILVALFEIARKRKHVKIWQFIALFIFFCNANDYIYVYHLAIFVAFIPICLSESRLTIPDKMKEFFAKKPMQIIGTIFYPAHLSILAIIKFIIMRGV